MSVEVGLSMSSAVVIVLLDFGIYVFVILFALRIYPPSFSNRLQKYLFRHRFRNNALEIP